MVWKMTSVVHTIQSENPPVNNTCQFMLLSDSGLFYVDNLRPKGLNYFGFDVLLSCNYICVTAGLAFGLTKAHFYHQ